MALKESIELKEALENYCDENIDFIVNDSVGQSKRAKKRRVARFFV